MYFSDYDDFYFLFEISYVCVYVYMHTCVYYVYLSIHHVVLVHWAQTQAVNLPLGQTSTGSHILTLELFTSYMRERFIFRFLGPKQSSIKATGKETFPNRSILLNNIKGIGIRCLNIVISKQEAPLLLIVCDSNISLSIHVCFFKNPVYIFYSY